MLTLTITCYILTTFIREIRQRPETNTNHLIVERVELAQGWNVKDVVKELDVPLKRALSRDHFAQEPGNLGIMNFYGFKPLPH